MPGHHGAVVLGSQRSRRRPSLSWSSWSCSRTWLTWAAQSLVLCVWQLAHGWPSSRQAHITTVHGTTTEQYFTTFYLTKLTTYEFVAICFCTAFPREETFYESKWEDGTELWILPKPRGGIGNSVTSNRFCVTMHHPMTLRKCALVCSPLILLRRRNMRIDSFGSGGGGGQSQISA